jgi:putative transposase
VIDVLVDAGLKTKQSCRVLGVTGGGYYKYRNRPLAPAKLRREWLTALIKDVHAESRGTCGSRRVHAELTKGRGVYVSERLTAVLMHKAGIMGLPGPAKFKKNRGIPTSDDLVNRPRESTIWSQRTERALGHGHHRTPHARGEGLLLLRARYLQPAHRRVVD